jgi:hypothetical protein
MGNREPVIWEQYLEKQKKKGLIRDYSIVSKNETVKPERQSKYRNKQTFVDGIQFDSKKEAMRYKELKLLLKVGEIGFLQCQVPYELNPGGTHSLKYIADFEYVISKTGEKITEDTKGFLTREYKKKRRLMEKLFGIKIKET